jgi:uncharacterized protein
VEKYETIEELFGLQKQIRVNDFMAVYNAMEKTRNWEALKDLSKLASKHYPKTMLANYFDARYEEEIGNPKESYAQLSKCIWPGAHRLPYNRLYAG